MALGTHEIECLLVALLAVNSFPADKVWKLLPRMREAGLADPARVSTMGMPATIEALTRAGYDRKNLTWMFAQRLKALMAALNGGELAGLSEAIPAKDKARATELLTRVHGVGPIVAEHAWALLTAHG
jgi:3-methyladenine DNA glycosylase/8-oxoguanine DNA glycosylase